MKATYSQRRSEIEEINLQSLCQEFLGSKLVVDTDCEKEQDGDPDAFKTEDGMFYFVPQLDDPVMSGATIAHPALPVLGKYRYSVEIGVTSGGSYLGPPDYDQVEIGREDSLCKAIGLAAHYILDQKMDGKSEGDYWNMEAILEKEYPDSVGY